MKKTLLPFAAALFACIFSISTFANYDAPNPGTVITSNPTPGISVRSFSIASIRAFDQYSSLLAKAKPLQVTSKKTALTNSSLTNSRPNGYTMVIPLFAVTHQNSTTDYYYTDNVNNGATVYFDIPDIAIVNNIVLYQLGENFHNWEWSDLTTNNGSTYIQGYADGGGGNWITYWDGNGPFDIIDGIDVIVY